MLTAHEVLQFIAGPTTFTAALVGKRLDDEGLMIRLLFDRSTELHLHGRLPPLLCERGGSSAHEISEASVRQVVSRHKVELRAALEDKHLEWQAVLDRGSTGRDQPYIEYAIRTIERVISRWV